MIDSKTIIKRRTVSVFCCERPPEHCYANTAVLITPFPLEIVPVQFLYTISTLSERSTVWRMELAQIVRPAPVILPSILSHRPLMQLHSSLRAVIEADMLGAGLLENKRLRAFSPDVIDLSSGLDVQ